MHTVRGQIRVPTVIVAVNYAKVPKKRPKLCARTIRERDGNRCQYTGRVLHPDEGSLDHVVPRSRGGKDAWENLVWSAKEVNQRKADRLPHEAGLKLLSVPRAPKELPISALIRNAHEVAGLEALCRRLIHGGRAIQSSPSFTENCTLDLWAQPAMISSSTPARRTSLARRGPTMTSTLVQRNPRLSSRIPP